MHWEEDNDDYSPTLAYKLVWATPKPKARDPKGGNYFVFLCLLTFDSKWFSRGHTQVYSEDDMKRFDADFQKQLSFNFCATRVTRKKPVSHHKARASRFCDVDLDITPTSFSRDTTDWHELSCYVLKVFLACTVGRWLIIVSLLCKVGFNKLPFTMTYSPAISTRSLQEIFCQSQWRHWCHLQWLWHNFVSTLARYHQLISYNHAFWQAIWPIASMGPSVQV